jgi:hypothetical protein
MNFNRCPAMSDICHSSDNKLGVATPIILGIGVMLLCLFRGLKLITTKCSLSKTHAFYRAPRYSVTRNGSMSRPVYKVRGNDATGSVLHMSNPSTLERGLSSKRSVVRLSGLPLVSLSFQTLGTSFFYFQQRRGWPSNFIQALSTPT